ncbi:E3 ubiquitin-protein ligase TRAF7-like isoform X1 [Mya arenaria]|uniref:E3 ubiquitin-protein ligase TRAF7-like isoform X1 n=1 Tax=Mya arenaria TaxID=6604 RepID=UPI0022E66599|nr:E3 ubiquitin-protein ligase TRAF7-like isoform X1 [Mya arenaria]
MATFLTINNESHGESPPLVYISEPSQHFHCPVCKGLYQEPVINIACGHTFCKQCSRTIDKCPLDDSACEQQQMVVNRLVVGQIEDLLIHCRYGLAQAEDGYIPDPAGCQEPIHFGARDKHENTCEFMMVRCANKSCEATCRKREIEEHKKVCIYNTCCHNNKGCEFQGRLEDVEIHQTTCGYRSLPRTDNNPALVQKTVELEASNTELVKQVTSLNMRVGQLEETNTALHGQLGDCLKSLRDLNQKYDTVVSSLEQLVAVRNRRTVGSSGGQGDGRPRSASSGLYQQYRQGSFRHSLSGSPPSSMRLERWNMPFQFKCIGTLRGHQDVVWCMASRDKKLYTAGKDRSVKVWDLENLQRGCIKTIQGHSDTVQCMCVGSNNLYTGGHDNSIYCWSLEDHTLVKSVQGAHDNIICAMAIVGEFLFTASFSLIKVWEVKTLTLKHTLTGLHHWVRALALNPDRDKLYSGSHNTINIWSITEPFSLKGKVDHQFGSIYSLAITSKYIIAGTYNRNVQVFDCTSLQHLRELMGHVGLIHSLATSLSGRFLFSAASDSSVQIWNLENMLPIQTLQRHEGSVNTLIVHGDFLFSGSEDKEIKVFMYFQMQMGFAVNT